MKSLNLKNIYPNKLQPTYVLLDWIKAPIIKPVSNETLTSTYLPDFPGYQKYFYVGSTSLGNYYFVKYMDYRQNINDCDLFHHIYSLYMKNFGQYNKITQRDVKCDKLATDQIQESKTFSWQEAFLLCRSINATLPEFYSRKEQEEFIAILKSEYIFPIEAAFLGLHTKVGFMFQIFIHRFCVSGMHRVFLQYLSGFFSQIALSFGYSHQPK